MNVARFEIGEVDIQSAKKDILLKKDGKDNWTLERENIAADNNEVNKLLNSIADLKGDGLPLGDGKNPAVFRPDLPRGQDHAHQIQRQLASLDLARKGERQGLRANSGQAHHL